MKRTQNEKILQIKNETLVVGIDIGKEKIIMPEPLTIEELNKRNYCDSATRRKAMKSWTSGCKKRCSKRRKPMPSWALSPPALLVHAGRLLEKQRLRAGNR